uniref:glutathione transferase n=1 Tax=Piliocolobus tephrosceles TaxID=591936 RepID=A0A8C9GML3_9PRIM
MESIRWCLATAGVQVDISLSFFFLLSKDGSLMFQQVPIVEIDGMKLVQTRAILNYIASKHNLYGKDIKERALYGLKTRISNLPTVKKFLQPGNPRKPPMDAKTLEEARKAFRF